MKRVLIVLLFLGVASRVMADPPGEDVHRPHAADGKWYLQFDLGLNWSFLNGHPIYRDPMLNVAEGATDLFNSASGIGPLFGVALGYQFTDHFALSLGLHYDGRHTSNSANTLDTAVALGSFLGAAANTPESISKQYTVNADYVTWSLLANFRFEHIIIYVGPRISIPVARTVSETDHIVDSSSSTRYFFNSVDATKTVGESITGTVNVRTRESLTVGVGYVIDVSKKVSLVPQLGYDIGLTDLLFSGEVNRLHGPSGGSSLPTVINPTMRINSLQATLGIRINL